MSVTGAQCKVLRSNRGIHMLQEQISSSTVLVMEADSSLRRLISLGLRHQGMQVVEAESLQALSHDQLHAIDLLVLDIDHSRRQDWSMVEHIQANPQLAALPGVVLAWECPPTLSTLSSHDTQPVPLIYVPKPFDARTLYSRLLRCIELREREQSEREACAEAALMAAYKERSTTSLWPVVTAAGLLLVVIGFLFQFLIVFVGLIVIVTSLFLWTLGSSTGVTDIALSVENRYSSPA
ncbi:MAG TPA: hypothetical protein VL461_06060 [Dictyobacter sp.]|nr:hypothetical protein [Dictyobacter sp.]